MAFSYPFELVTSEDVQSMRDTTRAHELRNGLARVLGRQLDVRILSKHGSEKREGMRLIFAEFMEQIAAPILSKLDTEERVSVALQICFDVFCSSFSSHFSRAESLNYMSTLLSRHAGDDPPRRILIFSLNDVKTISETMVDTFYSKYETYYHLFATKKMASFTWGPVHIGRFPRDLELEYGVLITDPRSHPTLKELYFSQKGDEELDELELEELLKGNGGANLTIKKKEEIIRRRLEADRKARIERVLQDRIFKLHQELGVHVDELRKEFDLIEATQPHPAK